MQPPSEQNWQVQDRFLELHSRWMSLIGEHWQDHQGRSLEYWRIEKADSVIILPIQRDRILLPPPSYRPGIGQATWDLPGGRMVAGQSPGAAAIAILQRELGIDAGAITELVPLNAQGWAINSSFSNQNLYGFIAQIQESTALLPALVAQSYPATIAGVRQLLQEIICLQCRAVVLEYLSFGLS